MAQANLTDARQAEAEIPTVVPPPIPAATRPQSLPDPALDVEALPAPIAAARSAPKRKPARKQDSLEKAETMTPATSNLQPGQLRKRRKPKA
jgi:hypothetical protein